MYRRLPAAPALAVSMILLSNVSFGPGLNIRNKIACCAPSITFRASFRSTCPIVGVNHNRSGTAPAFRSRALLLLFLRLAGVVSPAALRRSHCLRYSLATSLSSIRTELFDCVHRPVFVQFWLPVHTQRGLSFESQMTRNLLCPSARGEIIRLYRSIFPFSPWHALLF